MTIHLHINDLPPGLAFGDSVAIDSEAMGLQPHRDRLCVVQLSTGDGTADVVQIPQAGPEPVVLKRVLADPGILGVNAGAALALILGLWLRPVGYAAAFYCIVTSAFHFIPSDPWQMSIFVKNWAIAGGCLVLAAQGGGRYVMQATTEKTGERA